MKNFKKDSKSAFTLIELSIVLIIIGLLVAGVTGGASLIRSAQLRSVMSEARGYSVAVNAFVVQYDDLPGDYANPIGGTLDSDAGDGDSDIDYIVGDDGTNVIAEGLGAWAHLINSGTVDETITLVMTSIEDTAANNTLSAQTAGTHFPASRLDGVGWMFDSPTDSNGNVIVATGNIAALGGAPTATAGAETDLVAVAAIVPTDAFLIDNKLDDGDAQDGRVRVDVDFDDDTSECSNGSDYNTTVTTEQCALEFTIDIS